jgi:hypothetical protein
MVETSGATPAGVGLARHADGREATARATQIGDLSLVDACAEQQDLIPVGVGPHVELHRAGPVAGLHADLARLDPPLRQVARLLQDLREAFARDLVAAVDGAAAEGGRGLEDPLAGLPQGFGVQPESRRVSTTPSSSASSPLRGAAQRLARREDREPLLVREQVVLPRRGRDDRVAREPGLAQGARARRVEQEVRVAQVDEVDGSLAEEERTPLVAELARVADGGRDASLREDRAEELELRAQELRLGALVGDGQRAERRSRSRG